MEITMKLPSLPLFTDTFSAETVHLTNEQVGMYIRLLCFAWTKKGKPFTSQSAHTICQCKSVNCELVVNQILDEFFIRGENRNVWTHKRITTEINYLLDYYSKKSQSGKRGVQAKRNFASSETQAPIPIPIPIPTNNNGFLEFWKNLTIKRGSKKNAEKSYKKECSDFNPIELAKLFNKQSAKIQDKQFVPHVVTWINGRRFEDEDLPTQSLIEKIILPKNVPLGSVNIGTEGYWKTWIFPNGEKWNIHTFKDERKRID